MEMYWRRDGKRKLPGNINRLQHLLHSTVGCTVAEYGGHHSLQLGRQAHWISGFKLLIPRMWFKSLLLTVTPNSQWGETENAGCCPPCRVESSLTPPIYHSAGWRVMSRHMIKIYEPQTISSGLGRTWSRVEICWQYWSSGQGDTPY